MGGGVRRGGRRLALAAGLVAALGALLPSCGPGKSYFFPQVSIDATLDQDGSLSIVERRTYDFTGEFHSAFFTVEHGSFGDVVDFSVREGGVAFDPSLPAGTTGSLLIEDNVLEGPGGFKYKATWYYEAKDERRTFEISYRVLCAAEVFADTARLLWKFVGEGWTEPTDRAVITLHLPGKAVRAAERPSFPCHPDFPGSDEPPEPIPTRPLGADEVRAWGHGPLNGDVAIPDPQTVVLSITDLPPATYVEGNVTFPTEVVPFMYASDAPRLDIILSREARAAEEANRARIEAAAAAASQRTWRRVATGALVGFPVLVLLLVFVARWRDRDPAVPNILEQPPEPDVHPAVLAREWALVHRRSPRQAYRAELLHLARQGNLELRPVGTLTDPSDHEARPVRTPEDPLDLDFYEFLFGPADATPEPVTLNSYKPEKAEARRLDAWWKKVASNAEARAFGERTRSRLESRILSWTWLSGLLWSFVVGVRAGWPWFGPVFLIGALVLMYVARKLIPARLGPKRQQQLVRWRAFRRYLKDFSSLPTAPTAAVIIWERYLVFAVALGVADEVEKQVRALVPESLLPEPYPGAPRGLAGFNTWRYVAASHVVSAGAARSASAYPSSSGGGGSSSSSSGFGGGGFSGGGGGGGGGTGGGAN